MGDINTSGKQTHRDIDINIIIDLVYSDVYLKVYPANTKALVFDHSNR